MNGTALFEALAALCALLAAVFIFDQHLHRPRPHKLMWTLGLFFYGIAASAEFLGAGNGAWSVEEYKAWYYFGGVLTAAFLGLGSLYLLGPRRVGHIAAAIATVIAIYAGVRIVLTPFSAADIHTLATAPTSLITNVRAFKPLPGDMEAAAIIMNIPGSLLLFGGAAWSGWQFWKRNAPAFRLVSMALLALGAVFPSILTGMQALGNTSGAALGEFLGALCLLAGLLVSHDVFTAFRVPFTDITLYERRPFTPQPSAPASAPAKAR